MNDLDIDINFGAKVKLKSNDHIGLAIENVWDVKGFALDGALKFHDTYKNIIVNEGLDEVLDRIYLASAAPTYFVGLMGTAPTVAAADTMAAHGGWTEVAAYSEAVRQTLTMGAVAAQSIDNTANAAVFTINADSTVIGGAFFATNSTKSGSTGILMAGAAFGGGDRTLNNGETISIEVTTTAASV